jgi:multisite-specific tRNA:(cytosine-C5)-methyltransferase
VLLIFLTQLQSTVAIIPLRGPAAGVLVRFAVGLAVLGLVCRGGGAMEQPPAPAAGWGPAREWKNGRGQGVPSAPGEAPPRLPENHARKKRPPRNNEQLFRDYYHAQLGALPDEDRGAMFECLATPLPVTFRLVGPLQKGSTCDAADRYHAQLCDLLITGTDVEGGLKLTADALERLPWYPHRAAWKLAIGKKDMKNVANLQNFLLQETAAGSLVRMEAVSMIPSLVLGASPGDFVLDMCAAPGSKTGMCLEMVMHSRGAGTGGAQELEAVVGAVVANDPDLKRSKMMVHRTKALCSPSLVVTALPGQAFPQLMSDKGDAIMFDRVLCDVPCSGDGTIRKAPYNLKTWHVSHSLQYHLLQTLLLQRSIELTKVGGYIVYSTCSLNPIENEAVVSHVLAQAEGAVEICACPETLAALKRRPGLLHWRVPDANFPGKWYDAFDDVIAARTARGKAREAFSRRGLIRSMFCSSNPDGSVKDIVNGEPGEPHLATRAQATHQPYTLHPKSPIRCTPNPQPYTLHPWQCARKASSGACDGLS